MNTSCRLCNAKSNVIFEKTILGKHCVAFMECSGCKSMQTEEPYWLSDSYASDKRPLDVNAVSRAIMWQRHIFMLHRVLGLATDSRLLDWGAGDGLLVRLLRDVGVDAHYYDPLATNYYAIGCEVDEVTTQYDIVSAFEVWEHLVEPAKEISASLSCNPSVYLATTELYTGQDESWSYLNLTNGRHVFFYSPEAVELIAKQNGYSALVVQGKKIMLLRDDFPKHFVVRAKNLLNDRFSRLRKAYYSLLKKKSLAPLDRKRIQLSVLQEIAH